MTSYLVLRRVKSVANEREAWELAETVAATSSDSAIREYAAKAGAGTYVAVPARSWKPQTAKVETTPRVSLS